MTNATRLVRCMQVFALVFLLGGCQFISRPSWDLPSDIKTLPVNGYAMAYRESGDGPTVVLVHGALTDYRYWTPQLSSLSPRYRLIAVSLRHYYPEHWNGKSDDFSLKAHSEDLAAFIERLGAGPVYLVAHSRGGAVALGTAKTRPDLVKKLVLMEPVANALLPIPAGPVKPDLRQARAKTIATYFEKGDMEGGLEYFIDAANGPGSWKRRSEEERQFARDSAWTVVAGQLNDAEFVACADLRKMTLPVLLVGSEKITGQRRAVLNEAEKCLPSVTRVTIPNSAHLMNRDNPAAFDQALVEFLLR